MLIHPWDAATGFAEWQDWLATTDRFGILAVNNLDPAGPIARTRADPDQPNWMMCGVQGVAG